MVETGRTRSFREIARQAPEFNQPFVFGGRYWPFQEIQKSNDDELGEEKVTFEAHGRSSKETNPLVVRVSYEAPYGLKAKRTVVFRQYPGKLLMEEAEVRYKFGEIDIVIIAAPSSPLVSPGILNDPESFQAIIEVKASDRPFPPLARVDYEFDPQIPLNVDFVYGEFRDAVEGNVEKREKGKFRGPSYRKSYFQWEHLVGAKVGVSRYDDLEDASRLRYYQWYTNINNPQLVWLEGSPYWQKILRSKEWALGQGRLRFVRINRETEESWVLAVPEWIVDKHRFHNHIQHSPLKYFFWDYLVQFCVKRRGEERQWFSTLSSPDKAREGIS